MQAEQPSDDSTDYHPQYNAHVTDGHMGLGAEVADAVPKLHSLLLPLLLALKNLQQGARHHAARQTRRKHSHV